MVAGAIRSAYETDTHFYNDSNALARVLWYFVPEDTPNLPYPSLFCDTVWNERNFEVQAAVGELQTGHVYSKGFPPPSYPTKAKVPCGTAQQWLNGASINDPFPGVYTGTKVPTCCPDFLQLAEPGGSAEGGNLLYPGPCDEDCFRPSRVYLSLQVLGSDPCAIGGQIIPIDVFNLTFVRSGTTWKTLYRSPVVTFSGIDYRWWILCSVPGIFGRFVLAPVSDITVWTVSITLVQDNCSPWNQHTLFGTSAVNIPGCGGSGFNLGAMTSE